MTDTPDDIRQYEAERRIGRINQRRHDAAMNGEPGDPPNYICPSCGFEECTEDCLCSKCHSFLDDA